LNSRPSSAGVTPEPAGPGFLLAAIAGRPPACDASSVPFSLLIVDDNASYLNAARVLLGREGLSILGAASTVAEGLLRAEELRPDVVLVDIMLAGESGFELARRLLEDDRSGRPAVILISTHSEADFADLIAESPACGFLPKSDLSAAAIRRIVDNCSS
jgi:DNA-binding NarL/FixJ family response regulator